MEHHFNIKFAKLYGIEEAIIVHNLYFWIIKNIANNIHEHNGRYWTYNSNNAFVALFPYMNKTKICRVMAHLESENIIIKDNFNQDSRDRTLWYAFTDYGIKILNDCKYDVSKMSKCTVQNELCKIQNETTIPYNKQTDSKQKEERDKSLSKKKQNFNVRADLSYVDSKYANLWNEWLDYKDAINKQYKTQKGAISQYKSWIKFANNNIILAEAIVRRSIEYSWQGLFELKDNEIKLYLSNRNPYRSNNQQPYNGSNRLIDGENKDGTFNRNGYRYYYSMRDDREYSIPINAEPMPSIDYEFDMTTKKWIPPTTNNNVNGNLW